MDWLRDGLVADSGLRKPEPHANDVGEPSVVDPVADSCLPLSEPHANDLEVSTFTWMVNTGRNDYGDREWCEFPIDTAQKLDQMYTDASSHAEE